MEDLIKQHVFSNRNIRLYFLSPYCVVRPCEDGVYVAREDMGQAFLFQPSQSERMTALLHRLSMGMGIGDLTSCLRDELHEEDPMAWIQFCIQGGILE